MCSFELSTKTAYAFVDNAFSTPLPFPSRSLSVNEIAAASRQLEWANGEVSYPLSFFMDRIEFLQVGVGCPHELHRTIPAPTPTAAAGVLTLAAAAPTSARVLAAAPAAARVLAVAPTAGAPAPAPAPTAAARVLAPAAGVPASAQTPAPAARPGF